MGDSKVIRVNDLEIFMREAFVLSGVPEPDAEIVTDNLLKAEMKGISSHGLSRFPVYLQRIQKGLVNPQPQISIKKALPGVLAVDGDNGLGSVVMLQALQEGFGVADEIGVCVLGVKHSNHFGISTYYCEKAAEEGYVSILLSNGPPATPPFGGKEPYFGTNPIAFGMPRKSRPHIIVDMATSVAARGKIIRASQKGEEIPEGWALDQEGYPTTDAKAALAGVLLPIAGPKGAALSLMAEHFSGVLTGAGYGKGVAWQYSASEEPANVGHFMVLIKADSFLGESEYEERTETFVSEIKNLSRAPGFEAIKLPGEREWEREQAIFTQGIAMDLDLREQFASVAVKLNLKTELFAV
ncbi:MAG: lactate dehydrogenase [Gracilibacter sp. BRH_c7a]|nr:MAG: lactate dehydrogenase [Gracilibacter sp. BRH_c7a]